MVVDNIVSMIHTLCKIFSRTRISLLKIPKKFLSVTKSTNYESVLITLRFYSTLDPRFSTWRFLVLENMKFIFYLTLMSQVYYKKKCDRFHSNFSHLAQIILLVDFEDFLDISVCKEL